MVEQEDQETNGFAELRLRQFTEVMALRSKHVQERRSFAWENGLLKPTLQEIDPALMWEEAESQRLPYKRAAGFGAEGEVPVKAAHYCQHCDGWIEGEPHGKNY